MLGRIPARGPGEDRDEHDHLNAALIVPGYRRRYAENVLQSVARNCMSLLIITLPNLAVRKSVDFGTPAPCLAWPYPSLGAPGNRRNVYLITSRTGRLKLKKRQPNYAKGMFELPIAPAFLRWFASR